MVHLALVGCGGMGHYHAARLKEIDRVKVTALVDLLPAQTRLYRERYFPDAREYDDYEKLLSDRDLPLDGVVLVTPHTDHYPQAKAALLRGLHVLVEKPMVTGSAQAYDLWKTVKQTGRQLSIAFQSCYTPEFGYLARERDAGRLGRITLVSGWLAQNWLSATAGKWRQNKSASGGGQMYDSGAHLFNAIMWLLNDPVVEAGCFLDNCDSPVDINGVAILKFQNGAMGSVTVGGSCPANFQYGMHLQTDRMLILTDQYGSKLEMHGPGGKKIYPHIVPDDRPGAGSSHFNFVNAIEGHEPPRAPARYGVLLSALMDALYESAETGRMVRVKPVPKDIDP